MYVCMYVCTPDTTCVYPFKQIKSETGLGHSSSDTELTASKREMGLHALYSNLYIEAMHCRHGTYNVHQCQQTVAERRKPRYN
jgi:hypothetical protein